MSTETKNPNGMSFRELLLEVRDDVKELKYQFNELDGATVKKEELQMWRSAQVTTRRWAITTIITLFVLGVMVLGVVIPIIQRTN